MSSVSTRKGHLRSRHERSHRLRPQWCRCRLHRRECLLRRRKLERRRRYPREEVVTAAAIDNVVTTFSVEEVIARATDERIVAATAVDGETFGFERDRQINLRNVADQCRRIRDLELDARVLGSKLPLPSVSN